MGILKNVNRAIKKGAITKGAKLANLLPPLNFLKRSRQARHGGDELERGNRPAVALAEGNLDPAEDTARLRRTNPLPAFIRDGERVVRWGTQE